MTIFKSRIKKIGMPPGSLVHLSDISRSSIHISVIDYDAENFTEKENVTIEECLEHIKDKNTMTWINVRGIHDPKVIEQIGKYFGLHGLLLEDVMNASQRTKLDVYKNHLYIVMRMLNYDLKKNHLQDEQVSIIFGDSFLVSFLENSLDIFGSVRTQIRNKDKLIRTQGADFLCYALIDNIVDNYFLILETIDNQLTNLEEELMHANGDSLMKRIIKLKREVIVLHKTIWPLRDLLSEFRRIEQPFVTQETHLYMQDVYDHSVQAIETVDSFRDLTSSLMEIYLSRNTQRLNEIMKVLTVVATLFAPITFISSIYGMNFEFMPELHSKWGYPITLLVMFLSTLVMLIYFRRKHWI